MRLHPILAATILVLAPGLAVGTTQPEVKDPLRGPRVPDRVARTLVQRDAQGRLVRVEGRPEEAALTLLDLAPERLERAREVVADRAASLNRLLVDQIDLVRESSDAIRDGNAQRARELGMEMFNAFDPAHTRDPLMEPLSKVLDPAHMQELRRLVDEYWDAWLPAERRAAGNAGDERTRERLILTLFQEEIAQAYERTLRPYRERLERIYAATEPTPEQRTLIRQAVLDFIAATRLRPTPEDRAALARRIYEILDEERRINLVALALGAY
jgi:hypothetical protein